MGNDLAIARAADGVDLAWFDSTRNTQLTAHGRATGVFTAPTAPSGGWVALAGDAAGDQIVQSATRVPSGQPRSVAARSAGSTTVAPAPLPGPAWWVAAGSPTGGSLIAATSVTGSLRVATWRP